MGDTIYIAYNEVTEKWVNLPEGLLGHLDDLIDVSVASPDDGDVLTFDADLGLWVAIPGGTSTVSTLDDLTDVNVPSPDDGDVLTYDEDTEMWIASPVPPTLSPASTVESENALNNASPDAGESLDYARADHTHGTPPMPDAGDVGADATGTASGLVSGHESSYDHSHIPSHDEKAALVGTSGTPGDSNRYVTDGDSRLDDARIPTAHTHPLAEITDEGTMAAVNDAASDGKTYGRKDGTWAEVVSGLTHAQVMARIWVQL